MKLEDLICDCPFCILYHKTKYYCKNIIKIPKSTESKYIKEK